MWHFTDQFEILELNSYQTQKNALVPAFVYKNAQMLSIIVESDGFFADLYDYMSIHTITLNNHSIKSYHTILDRNFHVTLPTRTTVSAKT